VINGLPERSQSRRAGHYVRQSEGFRSFVPAPLPPQPPIDIDSHLLSLLSRADQAVGRLVALAAIPGLGLLAYGVKAAGEAAMDAEDAHIHLTAALGHVGAKAQQAGFEAKLGMMQYTNAIDDERLSGGLARLIQSTLVALWVLLVVGICCSAVLGRWCLAKPGA
jgi:hypothetical protein